MCWNRPILGNRPSCESYIYIPIFVFIETYPHFLILLISQQLFKRRVWNTNHDRYSDFNDSEFLSSLVFPTDQLTLSWSRSTNVHDFRLHV